MTFQSQSLLCGFEEITANVSETGFASMPVLLAVHRRADLGKNSLTL